jgi:putative FmdB family regulatory protein
MPIYEYECTNCGEKFEAHRKIADSGSEIKCPKCGKSTHEGFFLPLAGVPQVKPVSAVQAEVSPVEAVCLTERTLLSPQAQVAKYAIQQTYFIYMGTLKRPI